ncbi:uncharacterized protein C8A04DRAFT_11406 [Dichotomopilus funicola]|uniref:Uncharacterized protein n=1 Tax=Dichotomopilus funicola TaxID=1934379 RepID=A0AAN6V4C7_9PEZI|nr:hypothetical protein C8A04DRAFT_11406 [Dichotomopilus funicola]
MEPLFLSPALPSELLQFIIDKCSYPTTLIICGNKADFLASLSHDLLQHQQQRITGKPHGPTVAKQPTTSSHTALDTGTEPLSRRVAVPPSVSPETPNVAETRPKREEEAEGDQTLAAAEPHPLLIPHLAQLYTTRHIRTVFIPTVSHLRAFLSVFSLSVPPATSSATQKRTNKVVPPPPLANSGRTPTAARAPGTSSSPQNGPHLLIYNFIALHRHTSEWSIQGLGASSAVLVEAGRREGIGVVVIEERGVETGKGLVGMKVLLTERVPVLGGLERRAGGAVGERDGKGRTGWAEKTVDVRRVLGRWFRFREGPWDSSHVGDS